MVVAGGEAEDAVVSNPRLGGRCGLLACALVAGFLTSPAVAEDTPSDWELWSGGLFRLHRTEPLDLSLEYQVRLDDNLQALKSHFLEVQGYNRIKRWLELSAAYRLTGRPDHTEHRLMVGAWMRQTLGEGRPSVDRESGFDLVHQVAYQRDFNVRFTDELIDSNSVRWVITTTKPLGERIAPFLIVGALGTWNEEVDFDLDKLRLGVGMRINHTPKSRFRIAYILEESRLTEPRERSNIIWVRYELLAR